jgi:uncharacterized repeat protein (TIGR03803 family)
MSALEKITDSKNNWQEQMEINIMFRIIRTAGFSLFVAALAIGASAQLTVLHSFSGPDGASPTGLIQTADGSFYGAGANGGDTTACNPNGCGVLFKIDNKGNFSLLHVFHGTDGSLPTGLVKSSDGNFYGTTMTGGQPSGGGPGTIFRIDPAGNFTTLYAFSGGFGCCDAGGPAGPMIEASDGNFYGTAGGGAFRDVDHQGGFGTVYRFNPATGAESVVFSFNLPAGTGIFPNGPLIQAKDGLLYGTTREGPPTAFRISTSGTFNVVSSQLLGEPLSGLIQAMDGNFYGTTEGSGGTVYRIDSTGAISFINLFDGADGWKPQFRVLQAKDGFLYGTTPQGGLLDFQGGDMFRLSTSGTLNVLHSFTIAGTEGFSPNTQLVESIDGALYGTTGAGGINRHGTIFRFDQRIPGIVASVIVKTPILSSGQTTRGVVTLSTAAPVGGLVVNIGTNSFQVKIKPTVTVKAGAKRASFKITALNVGAQQSVRLYAWNTGQGVRTTFTLIP